MTFKPKPWRGTVDIKKYINDPALDWRETAVKVADRIGKAYLFGLGNSNFDQDLRDLAEDPDATTEDFNEVLDEIYDYADFYRIWLGS